MEIMKARASVLTCVTIIFHEIVSVGIKKKNKKQKQRNCKKILFVGVCFFSFEIERSNTKGHENTEIQIFYVDQKKRKSTIQHRRACSSFVLL